MSSTPGAELNEDFGEQQNVYFISLFFRISCWLGGLAAFFAGIALAILFNVNPPSPQSGIGPTTAYTISGVSTVAGLVILIAVIFYSKLQYEIYRNGVVRIEGRRREAIRYSDVVKYQDTINGIQFELANGTSTFWSLGPIPDPLGFRDVLRAKICECLWPVVKERFQNGDLIDFDGFTMDRDRLIYNGAELPWEDVAEVYVAIFRGSQTLCIKKTGAFLTFCAIPIGPRGGVPNPFLIEKIIGFTRPDLLIGPSASQRAE